MSARHFDYFNDSWKTEILKCPKCHWQGTFEQGSVEYHDQLMDCSCPKCDVFEEPMLAIVNYPTLEELRANQDKPGIREYVERIDAGLDRFAREKLREPDQLPEIDSLVIELGWDFDAREEENPRTLLIHGGDVIFSEPARYEAYERFAEITEILKAKYGHRLVDLVPTPRSEGWLYGDKLSAPSHVESVRDNIRQHSRGSEAAEQISLF
jgi:hypothetical protein